MLGKKYPSEIREYTDKKSGRRIKQLTQNALNSHFYFTDNSFDINNNEIYFSSTRGYGKHHFNIFKMDLTSGEMLQLTDEPEGVICTTATKTPDSEYISYKTGNSLRLLHTKTGTIKTLFKDTDMEVGKVHISHDKNLIGFVRNEHVLAACDDAANYSGFFERLFAIKEGRVTVMNIDGSGMRDVFIDTHQLGHFQFSPDDSNIAMFCHEGPWNYVHQRIWIGNISTGKVIPCFRQKYDDCVGHEFWTRDNQILFDNRGAGHDGTISSDKKQVVTQDAVHSDQIPYFGFADKQGNIIKTIEMPYYCNHYHANNDNTIFVGDSIEDIVLIRVDKKGTKIEILANHNTTWKFQHSHCHPTFSWTGDKILYAADTDDEHGNIFLVENIK